MHSTQPFLIRPAQLSDLEAAWQIVDRCRAVLRARGIHQWDDVYPTREVVEGDVERGRLFVALDSDGRPAAIVTVDAVQDAEYAAVPWTSAEPALVVHRLCVDPPAQGHGLGGQLMDFVESHARRQGFASIRLDAYTDNPDAMALYRRRGYREAGQVFFPRRLQPFACFERAL